MHFPLRNVIVPTLNEPASYKVDAQVNGTAPLEGSSNCAYAVFREGGNDNYKARHQVYRFICVSYKDCRWGEAREGLLNRADTVEITPIRFVVTSRYRTLPRVGSVAKER
jgi:hypothetical protein